MQATPIVSIASIAQPQTQIISSTPLAIAANTSQGQQLALASTQQAAHAGQILGTSQITLATGRSFSLIRLLYSNDSRSAFDNSSTIDGHNDEYIPTVGHVGECNATHHLVSCDDSQYFTALIHCARSVAVVVVVGVTMQ